MEWLGRQQVADRDPDTIKMLPMAYTVVGESTVHVAFTTESGKTGAYDYVINVIP